MRDRIVELFGDVSRIELFARKSSEGWAVWGNEVNEAVEGTITKVEEIIERTVENELPKFRRHKIENGTGYKN